MLQYKNTKTNSLFNVPDNLKIQDVDDWAYVIKMMIYNDERLIKNATQKLANCLMQIKRKQ